MSKKSLFKLPGLSRVLGGLMPADRQRRPSTQDAHLPSMARPPVAPWTLIARHQVNAGSVDAPLSHLVLTPPEGAAVSWAPGDLAEVTPRHPADVVDAWLRARGLDPDAPGRGPTLTLRDAVASSEWVRALPDGADGHALLAGLEPMRPRHYFIASIPTDGAVHLLVRRADHAAGSGSASAWLTDGVPVGGTVSLRLLSRPDAHLPPDVALRPLILIGNGTGLAGLMGHLKARIAAGQTRNWLLYGNRHAALDLPYRESLTAWRESGELARLDLAFSRDQAERVYVQHRLADASATLTEWVERGAAIHVCGSMHGMAGGVDAVLHAVLGSDLVDALVAAGRYRRDVY